VPGPVLPTLALFLVSACQAPPERREASGAAQDSVPCVQGDRMPRVAPDTTRAYTMRVVPPDSSRRYTMREQRVPLCPADSSGAPS
jgi:hypothetical protein